MGVGKTERAGLFESRFTKGRRIDATNDRILRNLRVNGGSIRKVGDKWELSAQALDGLKVCTFLDATTRQPKTISIKASDDAIIGNIEADGISLEDIQDGKIQIFDFDGDNTVLLGLQDCLEASPETGRIYAVAGEQYELLARVKNDDGSVRRIGYMPIGPSMGADPDGTGGSSPDDCVHDTYPDGSGGGSGGGGDGSAPRHDGDHPGTPKSFDDHTTMAHPGKTGPCW